MLQDSLFICYSTPNYAKLTTLCLNSLRDIHVHHINHKLDTPKQFNQTGFQTDLWYYCVRNKISHLIDVLSNEKYKYFIFTDCDIVYMKQNVHEWKNLEKYIHDEKKDIYFMQENKSTDINSGFFIIQNNIPKMKQFFIDVLNKMEITDKKDMPFGDQTIINELKHTIHYGVIPNEYVIFGNKIYNKDKCLFHHAVSCIDIDDKIKQIHRIQKEFYPFWYVKYMVLIGLFLIYLNLPKNKKK